MRPALVPIILADPLPWAKRAEYAWDFLRDRARFAGGYKGALANTPNWTFTRASTGYAQTSGGVLQSFASGELRRTDKGVLIEGAGTNLCLQSQTFDHASWTKGNCTVTANAIAAPDGTMTADLVTVDTTTYTTMSQTVGAVTGTNCTATVYIQAGNIVSPTGSVTLYDTTAAGNVVSGTITWATMSVSGTGASIERVGSTNWYRVTLSTSSWVSGNSARIYWGAAGGPLTIGSSWYVWGSQLEAAAFPSSYIPTTTASATRAADVLKITGLSIPAPHSVLVQGRPTEVAASSEIWNTETSSVSGVGGYHSTTQFVSYVREASASTAAPAAGTPAVQSLFKATYRFDTNNTEICANGTLGTVDVSNTPPTITQLNFGSGAYVLGGTGFIQIERFAIWTRALSDAELQSLTT